MRISKLLAGIGAACVIAFVGCSKSEPPPAPKGGFDPIKLSQAFQDSPSAVHSAVDQVIIRVRNRQYLEAIGGLDALLSDASVTDGQKNVLTNAIEQIKKKMEAPEPGAAQ